MTPKLSTQIDQLRELLDSMPGDDSVVAYTLVHAVVDAAYEDGRDDVLAMVREAAEQAMACRKP